MTEARIPLLAPEEATKRAEEVQLIAQFADNVGVMYAGKMVELSPVAQIVQDPLHPYSKLLLESVPTLEEKKERLVGIPGMPPRLIDLPPGDRGYGIAAPSG